MRYLVPITLFFCVVFSGLAEAKEFKSGPGRVSLLELYTSEGCSSCPPADNWFSKMKEDPELFKIFVPIGFHVTYWDYLGWKDELGDAAYTERQYAYGALWKKQSGSFFGRPKIYTPALVLDGRLWENWYRFAGVAPEGTKAGILTVKQLKGDRYEVRYTPHKKPKKNFFLNYSIMGTDYVSSVRQGENAGAVLMHDFSSLSLNTIPMTQNGDDWVVQIELKSPQRKDFKKFGFAAWVTYEEDLTPLQAVGGYLT